jgi:tetratricopeptide (TPR) repeat protein
MSTYKDRKYVDATASMKAGMKKITITMFRWKPDYLTASTDFNNAVRDFKAADKLPEAIEALKQCSVCDLENEMIFSAGCKLLDAAKLQEKLGQFKEAIINYEKAAPFLELDDVNKASKAYSNAAKICKDDNGDQCVELLMKSCEVYEEHDQLHFSVDAFRNTLNTVLGMQRYDQAMHVLKRMKRVFKHLKQDRNIYKLFAAEVIIALAMNDPVKARNAFNKSLYNDAYLSSGECAATEDLLRAFETFDEEKFESSKLARDFNYIDSGAGRLVRQLKLGNIADGGVPVSGVIHERMFDDMKEEDGVDTDLTTDEDSSTLEKSAAAKAKEISDRNALFGASSNTSSMIPVDESDAARLAFFDSQSSTTNTAAPAALVVGDESNEERIEDVIEGVKVNEDEDEILEAVSFGELEYVEDALTNEEDLDEAIARAKKAASNVTKEDMAATLEKQKELLETTAENEDEDDDFDLT